MKFVIFDAPEANGGFEERMAFLHRLKLPTHAEVVSQTKTTSNEHVLMTLKLVEKEGAEGLMLRQPNSRYEAGRSHTLLKVKSFFDDEAKVTGYNYTEKTWNLIVRDILRHAILSTRPPIFVSRRKPKRTSKANVK